MAQDGLFKKVPDNAEHGAASVTEILDEISGAWDRTQEGIAQAERGEGVSLDELA